MEAFTQKKYTCIVYPGIIENEEKMLSSLGGIQNISMVFSRPNRRLELRFRPEDEYCRSAYGDRHKTLSFLLKVKKKKKKLNNEAAETSTTSNETVIYEPIVMGRVEMTYTFKSLCDFQYLPLLTNSSGVVENIYPKLVPKNFPPFDWFYEDGPSFLPPAAFSRMDSIQRYLYRKESKGNNPDETPNIIGRTRLRRSAHAIFVTFDEATAPTRPRNNAVKYLELKFLSGDPYHKLMELFDKRPVWSKTALVFETKFKKDQLKYLLPCVAYYFVTGPFRIMWSRMSYDPRKDPSSRIYQTLDYRIPSRGGLSRLVKAKRRTDSILPFKSMSSTQAKTISILPDSEDINKESSQSSNEKEVHYIFTRGVKLPARQIFYQYADIKLPEVEEMFARLPKPPPDAECHFKRGWLPAGFAERVREIITNVIFDELEKEEKNKTEEVDIKSTENTFEGSDEDDDDFEDDDEEDEDEDDGFIDDQLSVDENSDDDNDDSNKVEIDTSTIS